MNFDLGVVFIVFFEQIVLDVVYVLNIFFVVGENILIIIVIDGNGNLEVLDYVLIVNDSCVFEVYGLGDMNVEIFVC